MINLIILYSYLVAMLLWYFWPEKLERDTIFERAVFQQINFTESSSSYTLRGVDEIGYVQEMYHCCYRKRVHRIQFLRSQQAMIDVRICWRECTVLVLQY